MTKLLSVFVITCFFISCTFTTTKIKRAEFNVDPDAIEANLKTLVVCDNINVNGFEKTTNGKATTEMDIKITNAVGVPADNAQMKDLAKKIAAQFKSELKKQDDFNTYKVLFATEQTGNGLTTTNSRSFFFKNEELQSVQ